MAVKKLAIPTKRLAISKANAQIMAIIAAACFVTIFCLFASKAVLSNNAYRAKVISAKEKANNQLETNLKEFKNLQASYSAFDNATTNVIGGLHDGAGDNDGSNSKIVLDALPTTYDFPALASSIEKILKSQNLTITSIQGVDDQVNQQGNSTSPTPEPTEIPFSFTVDHASYQSVQSLIDALQHSIRPIVVDRIRMSGGTDNMSVTVDAHTYYQPAKSVDIKTEVVK